MSNHPAPAALAAYVLGHHDEIDRAEIESHVQGCEDCMDEVGREARLELLLAAAAREDTFVAVLPLRARRRWPSVAAAAVALAAAAAAVGLWRSRTGADRPASRAAPRRDAVARAAGAADPQPDWSRGLRFGKARCVAADGGLTCAAASEERDVRDEASAEAGDLARLAMLEEVLSRGGPTITDQRAVFAPGKVAALTSPAPDRLARLRHVARLRHEVAEHALIGRRDAWFWEEYEAGDGEGSEFVVFVRFRADEKEIEEFLDRYRGATVDGALLVPTVPDMYWLLDPGEQVTWFVYRPGRLAQIGIRSRDVLLMNPRRDADRIRRLLESGEALVWRAGLGEPVRASQLP